jgi:hypothetical protein
MQGFWGLITEDGTTNRHAWTTLTSFYQGTLSCLTVPPVLKVASDTVMDGYYVTVNQPTGFYWFVSDDTSVGAELRYRRYKQVVQ